MSEAKSFTLTEEHIALLRASYVGWDGCEFGAAAIDCKCPYGNSDVLGDMAEILGVPISDDEWNPFDEDTERKLRRLHSETQTALEIVLRSGTFQPGEYVTSSAYEGDWRPA